MLFAALNFAEKFLGCEVDNLIYGQVNFQNGVPTNPQICDMVPLYYLNSVTNTIRAEEPDRARQMLKSLLHLLVNFPIIQMLLFVVYYQYQHNFL